MKTVLAYLITILGGPSLGALLSFILFTLMYPIVRRIPEVGRFATAICCGMGAFAFGFVAFRLLGASVTLSMPIVLAAAFLWNDSRRLAARQRTDDGSDRGTLAIKLAEADRIGDAAGVLIGYVIALNR